MKLKQQLVLSLIVVACLLSCNKENTPEIKDPFQDLNLPTIPLNYENTIFPEHFHENKFPSNIQFQFAAVESDNTPQHNPITNEGALLGRVLFYEEKLSANGTIACASCHKQELGFSDSEVLSIGFDGGLTSRHSMALANARFYDTGKFFWDERAETLEDQVLMPFQDPVEMGLTLEELVEIVESQNYTEELFTNAFGDPEVTAERISLALAQFVRSMTSFDSKYDQGRAMVNSPNQNFPNFTAQENLGKELFFAAPMQPSCRSCHMSEAFIAPLLAPNASTVGTNNGIDDLSAEDWGIYESTGLNNHRGKFKVPSLRNVSIRPPYMHDGRFQSLEEVIDHYSTGIKDHPNLQALLRLPNGEPIKFHYTDEEKAALIAFLHTLTDNEFLTDPRYSNPFK